MDAQQAADVIAERTGVPRHEVAIVLGSGWQGAAEQLGTPTVSVDMATVPGMQPPTAQGHGGTIDSVLVAGRAALVLRGRRHLYECHDPAQVVHGVRTAVAAGAHTVVLTNGAGGVRPGLPVGEPVLIADHLNLTGHTPLAGAQFVDLVDAWDPALRALARTVDASLTEGVYAGLAGPQYETPAEIRMLATLGADLVGMSTVLEAIACRALGARILGISLVTNPAAGVTGAGLSHAEVLSAGAAAAPRLGRLLRGILEVL